MRSRFVGLLMAATLLNVALTSTWAQSVDSQKIKNLKSQQTSIENRIADLQTQVDDASAYPTYCS